MAIDIELLKHKEWLGFLQPVGLVVSPPALVKAQAFIDRSQFIELQQQFKAVVEQDRIQDFRAFTEKVLNWESSDLVSVEELPNDLEVVLSDYGETLKPTYAIADPERDGWLMLVKEIAFDQPFDANSHETWTATPQEKFERLLREVQIPIGLLCNGSEVRLIYAPRGESSGHLTFPVKAMTEVAGRLILGAMLMLLSVDRLFNAPKGRSLKELLEESRKYQAEVSTTLANQVLEALWELLRGFQMADAATNGKLLGEVATRDPEHIYGGLITTLMRLVFLLYAEDEGLMPGDEVYQRNYAVTGLYEKLREDAGNYPDTMDQRYGAWAWLLSLFRLVYDGGGDTPAYLPARHGQLFHPNEYPFLEGQSITGQEKFDIPRIPDSVIHLVLEKLLILEGERLSYRSLDVEQIGSVYEGIMGYAVERAESPSIGVYSKPKGSKVSTTVVVDVAALLAAKPNDRAKLLKDWANCEISGNGLKALKEAKTLEELISAIERRISKQTPNVLTVGSLYLQPGEERRRSGSHYTPRSLTEPIVRKTLEPVLAGLGERPTAEQILSLKVCDLAMGSGAFLVEACRQLAEQLVAAWARARDEGMSGWADQAVTIALTESDDPLLVARRLVAQRCLYGVDKNPFAVNLAKLSLWLVTLAKDLPFTFLDHALKCGDSLVGLSRSQIGSFGKDPIADLPLMQILTQQVDRAKAYRGEIQAIDTLCDADDDQKRDRLAAADIALKEARLTSDVAIAAFFETSSKKERQERNEEYAALIRHWRMNGSENAGKNATDYGVSSISWKLRNQRGITPFNWEVEFPEVFDRENPGFDAIVGNPPFLGGSRISAEYGMTYFSYLTFNYPEAGHLCDLVAYFFRRAFSLIRQRGTIGFIATNTISQGDTRKGGLGWICTHDGTIYEARRRMKWGGMAVVIVSVIHIHKGKYSGIKYLDGRQVDNITAFLFHAGGHNDPAKFLRNKPLFSQGSKIYGQGFLFDDRDERASSLAEMEQILKKASHCKERILPYIGGKEINESPTHAHHRHVIYLSDLMEESELQNWSEIVTVVQSKVKPERDILGNNPNNTPLKRRWWAYQAHRPDFYRSIQNLERILVSCIVSKHLSFVFLPTGMIYSHKTVLFSLDRYSHFAVLQSRVHEAFARFFSSTMKDDLNYSASDCFETFPFPENWETDSNLEAIGKQYYEFRAALMVQNNQGLTDTYNRFHDPNETDPQILELRHLHEKLDQSVLAAYGWSDLSTDCEFLLDYEDDEDDDPTKRQRKKPWRYRWSEDTHDEVLARLLDLNQHRHEQEILGGKQKKAKGKRQKTAKTQESLAIVEKQLDLLPPDSE